MIKAHKGAPPPGWENVPGMSGFIREKTKAEGDTSAEAVLERLRGPRGPEGKPGKDGRPGRDGERGQDGESLAKIQQPDEQHIEVVTTRGQVHRFALPRGPAGEPGQPGVSIAKVYQSRDGALVIKLTDGAEHSFSIPERRVTVLGGGGGAGGGDSVNVAEGGGLELDPVSGELRIVTWMFFAGHWDTAPSRIGAVASPVAGDLYEYVLRGVTRYRLVPATYTPAEDAFYSDDQCTELIVRRDLS